VVQHQAPAGVEAMVGISTDPSLGPLVVAGLGGVQVELLNDAVFRLPPLAEQDAVEMLGALRGKRIFDGFRGAPPADRGAMADVIVRVAALADLVPELEELDLNPVRVLAVGKGAVVVDARMRLAPRKSST
jgi:acyl-CoA synthetase (NDP forming)